ncbi:hypothetical protein GGX14DRAFT_366760 [Mycena pura]|uniref:Protein kinase domain-containing protein n=1 Tax=Mycena pura TaxID=153505 RepID=A0AAD6Y9L6_9AGAR|nr:hypothetical protein GGX14DRAFT_366760 [Mycena pura]
MLKNEGRIYDALPAHLSEGWSGFNAVRVPNACCMDTRVPATAVVPNFYGYFVPVEESRRGMAILLLEDCGKPIIAIDIMVLSTRAICSTFLYRLKHEEFMQNSFYDRNVLMQPGPLTLPPHRRSLDTPSFRLIDFGRGRSLEILLSEHEANGASEKARKRILREWEESFRSGTTNGALCAVLGP